MRRQVDLNMETMGIIHVSAPDHPEAGRRNLPLERGPVAMRGVRDPMRGPGPYEGSGTRRGSGLFGRSGALAA